MEIFDPIFVPVFWVDRIIPFQPHWIWIYFSTYLYVPITYLFLHEEMKADQFFAHFFWAAVVGSIIFWIFPTAIQRETYEVTESSNFLDHATGWAILGLQQLDTPKNCIPSFHVAMTWFATWSLRSYRPWISWCAWSLFFLIVYSTMAVKQHYFLDVLSGSILGLGTTAAVGAFPWLVKASRIFQLPFRIKKQKY